MGLNFILGFIKEVKVMKVNFNINVKVVSVSNLIKYYISKGEHIVWSINFNYIKENIKKLCVQSL